MEYMAQRMDDYMEAGNRQAEAIFDQMNRFEDFYLSIPDADETLITEKKGYFEYENETVNEMWFYFRKGAGV
jgi:hypothetical protein